METKEVELQSLVGRHVLDGVDMFDRRFESEQSWGGCEDANCMRFRLDGVTYLAIEDPDDGYRSSLGSLISTDEPIQNSFVGCPVLCRMADKDAYTVNDYLEMIDEVTGRVVLSVGTANTYDYYPWFVAQFDPTAMAINQKGAFQ